MRKSALRGLTTFGLLMFVSLSTATAVGVQQRKNVLLLFDENKDFLALARLERSLTSALKAGTNGQLDIYSEYMDLSRFPDEDYKRRLANFFRQKYYGKRIDLILPVMGPSLNFLLEYRKELFPNVPIVFCGIDKRELEGKMLGPDVTGVLVKREFKPTLELAVKLHPDVNQFVLIGGSSGFNSYWESQARAELGEKFEDRIPINYWPSHSMEDLRREVAQLPLHTMILYLHVFRDGAGNTFSPDQALRLIAEKANVPIYAFVDQFIGSGALGGHVWSIDAHGAKAAELGLRILRGESPRNIAVYNEDTNVDMFDWRQLQRWKISENRLPQGSVVRFREPSIWERYKWYLAAGASVCLVEVLLILGLQVNRMKWRRAEAALSRLTGRLIEAQEEERRRIAREIHDDYQQRLALLTIDLQELEAQIEKSPVAAGGGIHEIWNRVAELGTDLHALSHSLHSSTLETLGLVAGVKAFCREFANQQEIQVDFADKNVPRGIQEDVALCLFRVVQEGLRNIKRHSGADRAEVQLEGLGETLHLSISDHGKGFDSNVHSRSGGIGIRSMEERLRPLGGHLEIRSRPTEGTRIDAWLPFVVAGQRAS